MPRRCTEAARCSGIRNRRLVRTRAGRPDSRGRMFGLPPARRPTPSRSPKSPEPKCASEPLSGLPGAIGLRLRFGTEIGVGVAIGVAAGGRRLALLVARKTTVAEVAAADITALDAERKIP